MKLKSFLLTSILSLFFVSGLLAQEQQQYNYAIISVEKRGANAGFIYKTKLNVFSDTQHSSSDVATEYAEKALIEKVEEYNRNGWEVYQSNIASIEQAYLYAFFLRKKKVE